jgi:hypothetical protein
VSGTSGDGDIEDDHMRSAPGGWNIADDFRKSAKEDMGTCMMNAEGA